MNRRFAALLAVAALALLTPACSKNDSSSSTTTTTTSDNAAASGASTAGDTTASGKGSTGNGAQVFTQNCSSCHQASGQGNAVFPPLAKNPVVTGDPKKVIAILKHGLNGKIAVNGHTYNGQMPAWKGQLSDGDIAAVITYIRSSWGNKASAVTAAQVTAVP